MLLSCGAAAADVFRRLLHALLCKIRRFITSLPYLKTPFSLFFELLNHQWIKLREMTFSSKIFKSLWMR